MSDSTDMTDHTYPCTPARTQRPTSKHAAPPSTDSPPPRKLPRRHSVPCVAFQYHPINTIDHAYSHRQVDLKTPHHKLGLNSAPAADRKRRLLASPVKSKKNLDIMSDVSAKRVLFVPDESSSPNCDLEDEGSLEYIFRKLERLELQ